MYSSSTGLLKTYGIDSYTDYVDTDYAVSTVFYFASKYTTPASIPLLIYMISICFKETVLLMFYCN